jgi:hypothetical protein
LHQKCVELSQTNLCTMLTQHVAFFHITLALR